MKHSQGEENQQCTAEGKPAVDWWRRYKWKCEACRALADETRRSMLEKLEKHKKEQSKNGALDLDDDDTFRKEKKAIQNLGLEVVDNVCSYDVYKKDYTSELGDICEELTKYNVTTKQAVVGIVSDIKNLKKMQNYDAKIQLYYFLCVKTAGLCPEPPKLKDLRQLEDKCEKCKLVMADLNSRLARYRQFDSSLVSVQLEEVCAGLDGRLGISTKLNTFCDDFVEEYDEQVS
jgi:hypothetical protein